MNAINQEHHQLERLNAIKREMNADNEGTVKRLEAEAEHEEQVRHAEINGAKAVAEIPINDAKTEPLLKAIREEHHMTLLQLGSKYSEALYQQQLAAAQAAAEAAAQFAAQGNNLYKRGEEDSELVSQQWTLAFNGWKAEQAAKEARTNNGTQTRNAQYEAMVQERDK
eukprot:13010714-Heterocapsa_arctica.AAC.1